jgi:hypothetical protein
LIDKEAFLCQQYSLRFNSFSGYTKLMVVGGNSSSNDRVSQFEIVDLSHRNSECQAITNVPTNKLNVVGGLGLNELPLVCDLGQGSASKYVHLI